MYGPSDLRNLLRLQDLDLRILRLRHTRDSLASSQEVAALEAAVGEKRALLEDTRGRLVEARKAQRREESELKLTQFSIKDLGDRLYGGGVTNPKEAEGLSKKLDGLMTTKAAIEDRIISAMETIESLEAEEASIVGELERLETDLLNKRWETQTRLREVEADLETLDRERAEAASVVDPKLLAAYSDLGKARGGVAVAGIVEGARCGACHIELPSGLVLRARAGKDLVRCENCGRIVVGVSPEVAGS